jgi:hypothetical protein
VETDREVIRVQVERFARRLCRRFAPAFTDGDSKEEVLRWLRAALPPHPGRRRKATITEALELNRKGVAWSDIYTQCIPGYQSLRWQERRKKIARLRNAVRARRGSRPRQASKNSPVICHNEKNDRALFASVAPATVIV